MKKIILMGSLGLLALGLMVTPLQADFVQCPAAGGVCGPAQGTTDNDDLINGSPLGDSINGGDGDDIIFGGAGRDITLFGGEGNDIIFGGPDSDEMFGSIGNDVIFPGPDNPRASNSIGQVANGGTDTDVTNVFVGETTTCLAIEDDGGTDTANLIGFGPYSAQKPFGQPGFGIGYVIVIDPIAGGIIAIEVNEDSDSGIETINGLLSPNVTIDEFPFECDGLLG